MKEIHYADYADKAVAILSRGAFLNTAADGTANTMTIAWGAIGHMWNRPVFTVMVRKSRYSYHLIENNSEFTVTLPLGDMQAALKLCGTQSGRDTDKFEAAGLTTVKGQKVSTPAIQCEGLHFECKVIYKQTMIPENLAPAPTQQLYANNDWHTLYYGEIVSAYQT